MDQMFSAYNLWQRRSPLTPTVPNLARSATSWKTSKTFKTRTYLAVLMLIFYSGRVPLHMHPMDVRKLQNDLKAEVLARQAVEVEAIKARASEKASKGRSQLFVQLSSHSGLIFDLEQRANQANHLRTFTPGGLFVEAVDIQLQAFSETLLLASKCCLEIQPILELVWLDCESKCYLLIIKLKNGK